MSYKIIVPIIIIFIQVFFISCNHFSGVYYLESLSSKSTNNDILKLRNILQSTAVDYGFIEYTKMDNKRSLFIKSSQCKTKYDSLKGSDGIVRIYFINKDFPIIGIIDNSNSFETEFIKSLKNTLEKRMTKILEKDKINFTKNILIFN